MQLVPIRLLVVSALAVTVSFGAIQEPANSSDQLSSKFSQAAIAALVQIHRWKEKVLADAKSTLPSPTFGKHLKTEAFESLRQAQLSSTTQGDKRAGETLQHLFSNVNVWADKLIQARKNLDATRSMDPNAFERDDELIKIVDCERSYNAMLGTGVYTDIAPCR